MVRPGPKTRMEDVKTAIVKLLQDNPDGLNFNKIFQKLKKREALGSFSVLDRAMKDLKKSGVVVLLREVKEPRYKIPMKIYSLAPKTQNVFKKYEMQSPLDVKNTKETQQIENLSMDLFEEMKIEIPSEAAFLTVLLRHARQTVSIYEQVLKDNGDPKGLWRLLLNDLLRSQRNYMETRAQWVRSGKISKEETHELVAHSEEVIWYLITTLTAYGIRLKIRESTE